MADRYDQVPLDTDDDYLLDWGVAPKRRICGIACEPPAAWYRLSSRQRAIARCGSAACAALVLVAVLIAAASAAAGNSSAPLVAAPTPPVTASRDKLAQSRPPLPPPPPPPPRPPRPTPETPTPQPTPPPAQPPRLPALPAPAPQGPQALALSECAWDKYRLPSDISPQQYDLHFDVDLAAMTVAGTATIHLDNRAERACVVLHAAENVQLDPDSVKLLVPAQNKGMSGVPQRPHDKRDGQLHLRFKENIPIGNVTLALDFSYPLNTGLQGFYRSSYISDAGQLQWLAASQFEAMSARKAFPCFDEPALKAVYNVSITADSAQTVLFNTAARSVTHGAGGGTFTAMSRTRHAFELTPPMSTYLVAMIVGPLEQVGGAYERAAGGSVPVRVWGRQGKEASLRFALEVAIAALRGYEELLQVPYALAKLDLVGIPDFQAGAMENWGLVTFREVDLLVPLGPGGGPDAGGGDGGAELEDGVGLGAGLNTSEASIQQLHRVPTVVAHELAHMWFGDLVTLPWWTQLWLNEGFATYFEKVGAAAFWHANAATPPGPFSYMREFGPNELDPALTYDAGNSSFALAQAASVVESEVQAESIFGAIVYPKGGSVLRMVHAYVADNSPEQRGEPQKWQLRRLRAAPAPAPAPDAAAELIDDESDGGGSGGAPAPAPSGAAPGARDAFFAGLTDYVRANEFGSGDTNALWAALERSTGVDGLAAKMATWTHQQGVPVVIANFTGGTLSLTQKQLTNDGLRDVACGAAAPEAYPGPGDASALGGASDAGQRVPWWLAVRWRGSDGGSGEAPRSAWLEMGDCTLDATLPVATGGWVYLNAGHTGLYRVLYDDAMWERILAAAAADVTGVAYIPDADFSGFLLDAYALAATGLAPPERYLDLFALLATRTDMSRFSPPPEDAPAAAWQAERHQRASWLAAARTFPALMPDVNADAPCLRAMSAIALSALGADLDEARPLQQLGVDPELAPRDSWDRRRARQILTALLVDALPDNPNAYAASDGSSSWLPGLADPAAAVAALVNAGKRWVRGGAWLSPDVRQAALALYALDGGRDAQDELISHYKDASDAAEKERTLRALAYADSTDMLPFAKAGVVPSQDVPTFVLSIARRSVNQAHMAWAYITANLGEFEGLFGGNPGDRARAVDTMLARVAARFDTRDRVAPVERFFASRPHGGSAPPPYVRDAVVSIRRNAHKRDVVVPAVCAAVVDGLSGGGGAERESDAGGVDYDGDEDVDEELPDDETR